MAQDLRTLASRLVDTGSPGALTSAFLVESAWGDLLAAISGVSRLQLAAVLTRHRPTLLPPGSTGADVASAADRYRADVVTAAAQSTFTPGDDLGSRFDAGLADLRALGDLGAVSDAPPWSASSTSDTPASSVGSVAPAGSAGSVAPAGSASSGTTAWEAGVSTGSASSGTPAWEAGVRAVSAGSGNPTWGAGSVAPSPASPDLGTPLTPAVSLTSAAGPDGAMGDSLARKAELTRAATVMTAFVRKAVDLPSTAASTRATAPAPSRPKAAAPAAPQAKRRNWYAQALANAVGAYFVALVVNSMIGLDHPITVAGSVIGSLALALVVRRPKGRRFFAALPGSFLLASASNLGDYVPEGAVIAVTIAGALYMVGYLIVAGRRAPKVS